MSDRKQMQHTMTMAYRKQQNTQWHGGNKTDTKLQQKSMIYIPDAGCHTTDSVCWFDTGHVSLKNNQ